MAHTTPSEAEVVNTLSSLALSKTSPQKPKAKPKSAPVADSWDDELSSGSDTETETSGPSNPLSKQSTTTSDQLSPINTNSSSDPPNPPPPTPASPTPFEFPDNVPGYGGPRSRGNSGASSPARRPEKTTAVAGRLIAGALGVRAPRRTDEEREYDKAMREKERKNREEKRNKEKAEAQAQKDRKRAVWED